jgi:hypothetical protein
MKGALLNDQSAKEFLKGSPITPYGQATKPPRLQIILCFLRSLWLNRSASHLRSSSRHLPAIPLNARQGGVRANRLKPSNLDSTNLKSRLRPTPLCFDKAASFCL